MPGPSSTSRQGAAVATEIYDGWMSAADKRKLDSLPSGSTAVSAFRYTVQPGDGGDFYVAIPADAQLGDDYALACTVGTAGEGAVVQSLPVADRTSGIFRVIGTDDFTVGTILEFILSALTP